MTDEQTADGTKAALLDAAAQAFAEKGFAGASIRDITARAGANLAAVTYHFGSKVALWEAVLIRGQSQMLEVLERAAWGTGSTLERLEGLTRAHFAFLSDHADIRRLIIQVVLGAEAIPEAAAGYVRRLLGLFAGLIARGQSEGIIRQGEPRLLTVAVLSQSFMLNIMRTPLKAATIDLDDATVRAEALDSAMRFIRAGLARSPTREN